MRGRSTRPGGEASRGEPELGREKCGALRNTQGRGHTVHRKPETVQENGEKANPSGNQQMLFVKEATG